MPIGRVFRQVRAQYQQRETFAEQIVPVTGSLAETLDDATSAASGASGASGSVAETFDDATSAAAGTFSPTGTLAETLDDLTPTASGSQVTGTLSETLDNVTSAATGTLGVTGSLAETLDNATSAAAGTFSTTGTLAETLDNATSAATGSQVTGTLAETLDAVTVAASGTYGATNYTYDFTGSNGAAWAGWTTVVGTVDIQSNKGRQLTAATAYAVAAAYYNTALPQDYDLRVDSTITTVTAAEFYGTVNVRAGSTSFTDMMQWSSWHLRFVGTATLGIAELYRVNSSGAASAILASGTDIDFVQGTVLHVRVRTAGAVFKARYWKDAESEPSTWQIDYTDATPPTGTGLSLGVRAGNNASADDWRWDDFSVVSPVTGTLAETLDVVAAQGAGTASATPHPDATPYQAPAQLIVTGGTYRRRYTMRRGVAGVAASGTSSISGTAAVVLEGVAALSALLDESSSLILDENGNPIYGAGAAGTHGRAGTVDRTLENTTAAASGGSTHGGNAAITLGNITSAAAGALGVTGTVAKSLGNVTSAAFGASSEVSGTVTVTLDAVETGSPLTDDLGAVITDDAGNIVYVRGAEGTHGIGATLAVTLADVTSAAAGAATENTGSLAETLENVTSDAAGTFAPTGSLEETLADTTVAAAGTLGVDGTVAVTLANATSTASGTSDPIIVAGNVGVTLADATSAASGTTVGGTLAETLADTTSAASGTAGSMPVTGTAAVALADVTSTAAGTSTSIGTLDRPLADLVGDGVGSSVTGTVDVTLEDVTSTTLGNVTITVYGVGRIESVYQMGPIEAIYETGRVVAVAGSRV